MFKTLAFAAAAMLLLATAAEARPRHHHTQGYTYDYGTILSHPAGCPRSAFCGCGVCTRLGHSAAECKRLGLWRAAAYYRYARTSAAPGMVAIFRGGGHVAYIEAVDANGNAVLYDPNSGGHQTRRWTRSLRGATIVNPHSRGFAAMAQPQSYY